MGRRSDITDAVSRLERSIKRTAAIWSKDSSGRAQGRTLSVLAENDGAKASELANLLNLSPSSLSEKLQKLEDDGNIERVRDKNDLRVVRVYITKKGKETLAKRKDGTKKAKTDFTSVLTDDEAKQFENICKKLTDSLDSVYAEEKRKRLEFLKLQREINDLDKMEFDSKSDVKTG